MERRDFIGLSMAGVSASLVSPKFAVAGNDEQAMAGGVFYTKQNPGRWSKKVAGHLPTIEINQVDGKVRIQVSTAHGMDGYQHYIVKHVLLDQDYNFLNERMFDPMKDKSAISTFTLDNYKGPVYVLSMCNKHDVWLNSVEI